MHTGRQPMMSTAVPGSHLLQLFKATDFFGGDPSKILTMGNFQLAELSCLGILV
jgi:hypothetical protein